MTKGRMEAFSDGVIAILIPLSLMIIARRHVMTGLTFGVIREK